MKNLKKKINKATMNNEIIQLIDSFFLYKYEFFFT